VNQFSSNTKATNCRRDLRLPKKEKKERKGTRKFNLNLVHCCMHIFVPNLREMYLFGKKKKKKAFVAKLRPI